MPAPLVFLVEDELLIREVLAEELVDAGFEVVVAEDGLAAIAALDVGATRFRALVTDIRLGRGPDGWDVSRRAREHAPGIPVVYTSGDSMHDWAVRGVPGSVMVTKPFLPADLIAAIARVMAETGPAP